MGFNGVSTKVNTARSLFLPLSWCSPFCTQLLLKVKVAKAVASTGPRKGQTLKALLGFHSSKADGMLYGMSPAEGCFFRWKMVRKCCTQNFSARPLGVVVAAVAFTVRFPRSQADDDVPHYSIVPFPGGVFL